MKKIIVVLCILLPVYSYGQKAREKKVDIELGVNYSFAAVSRGADDTKYKLGGYIEVRYNLPEIPVDVGLQLSYSTLQRSNQFFDVDYDYLSIAAVGDYSFRRGAKINPYVGLGMGVVLSEDVFARFKGISTYEKHGTKASFICAPRIGVKFVNHINLSLDYTISDKNYSRAHVRLGFYF